MTREIEFRAWFKDIGMQYHYNPYESYDALMQYTGLKDKNGRKIYEGDIVWRGQTYYRKDKNGRPPKKLVEWIHDKGTHNGFNIYKGECYEVLGNIYENPELFNTKK